MSDINVSVEDLTNINVGITNTPINVSASILGTKGDTGPSGGQGAIGLTGPAGSGDLGGVTGLNNLTGLINITGTGIIYTYVNGTTIYISGDTGAYSNFAQKNSLNSLSGNLILTGQTLDNKTNTLSGYLDDNFVKITGNQTVGGIKTFTSDLFVNNNDLYVGDTSTSINGTTTYGFQAKSHSNPYSENIFHAKDAILVVYANPLVSNQIGALGAAFPYKNRSIGMIASGYDFRINVPSRKLVLEGSNIDVSGNFLISGAAPNYASISNLGLTGQNLYLYFQEISGDLSSTGSSLLNSIGLVSGNLIASGKTLYNFFNSLSGNLETTGQYLYLLSQGISGNITNTGQTVFNYFSSLSGNLGSTGQTILNLSRNSGYFYPVFTYGNAQYTLVSGDSNNFIRFTGAQTNPILVSCPNYLPLGFRVSLIQDGSGQILPSGSGGAIIQSRNNYSGTIGPFSEITLLVKNNSAGNNAIYNLAGDLM